LSFKPFVVQACEGARLHHPRPAERHAVRFREGDKEKGAHQEFGSDLWSDPARASGKIFISFW